MVKLTGIQYAASAYVNGSQALPNTTLTVVSFNAEYYNYGNIHNTAKRMTAPVAGLYSLKGTLSTDGADTMRWLWFAINGATLATPRYGQAQHSGPSISTCVDVLLNAGDYVEMCCYQNTGVDITMPGNNTTPTIFSIHKIL